MTDDTREGGDAGVREEWRPVPGWKHYEVSNLGRVRSKDRVVPGRWGSGYTVRGRVMKLRISRSGHHFVSMTQDGVQAKRSVARLVASAWLGFDMDDVDQIILHRNDDVADNRPSNLRFGTADDLSVVRERRGTDQRGEDVQNSTLTREQVRDILDACASGASARGLARKYGVSKPAIVAIRDRKTWSHVEYGHRESAAGDSGMVPEPATGHAQTGMVPYGFQRSACGCYVEPNRCEREAYRKMMAWRTAGVSFSEIARRLSRLGHRSRTGGDVTSQAVHGILSRYPTEALAPWGEGSPKRS